MTNPLPDFMLTPAQKSRFEAKFERGPGCWNWTASVRPPRGYGQFALPGGRVVYAHRVAFAIYVAPIPAGLFVCHRCDNVRCVNPSHLFVGTHSDNMRDMANKGRGKKTGSPGSSNGRARLSRSDVEAIRALSLSGQTGVALSRRFAIGPTAVSRIINRKAWQ